MWNINIIFEFFLCCTNSVWELQNVNEMPAFQMLLLLLCICVCVCVCVRVCLLAVCLRVTPLIFLLSSLLCKGLVSADPGLCMHASFKSYLLGSGRSRRS